MNAIMNTIQFREILNGIVQAANELARTDAQRLSTCRRLAKEGIQQVESSVEGLQDDLLTKERDELQEQVDSMLLSGK